MQSIARVTLAVATSTDDWVSNTIESHHFKSISVHDNHLVKVGHQRVIAVRRQHKYGRWVVIGFELGCRFIDVSSWMPSRLALDCLLVLLEQQPSQNLLAQMLICLIYFHLIKQHITYICRFETLLNSLKLGILLGKCLLMRFVLCRAPLQFRSVHSQLIITTVTTDEPFKAR